jgi:MFS family permease
MSTAAATRPEIVRMTALERRAAIGLASISGLRMLGMFIVLPVFAFFAETLPGGRDRTLVGLALGAYGLTQAVLQVPFGWASDKWGRRPVIYSGLRLFAAGSFLAAWAPTIAGRSSGAPCRARAPLAVVIALCADSTRESVRTRDGRHRHHHCRHVRASLVAGPLLNAAIGVPGIFALTGVLALFAIAVVRFGVPEVAASRSPAPSRGAFRRVIADANLLRLNYGIFALHALFMALFVEMPFALRDNGVAADNQWEVYLPVIVLSVAMMWPFARAADQPQRGKPVFVGAVGVLLIAQAALAFGLHSLPALFAGLLLFFAAFNLLEATLPSLVSRYAPSDLKGSALGVYASVQFLGAFAGAAIGGWLAQHAGAAAVFGFGVALTAVWLVISLTMAAPPAYPSTYSMGET